MSDTNDGPDATPVDDSEPSEVVAPEAESDTAEGDTGDTATYPASVVRDLREKNGRYRTRAHEAEQHAQAADARADTLSRQLFTARVEATGKLSAADDLVYEAELLDDAEALNTAIDALISERPHYAKRTITGAIGQGVRGAQDSAPSFASLLR